MIDREKVIKALGICAGDNDFSVCINEKCPYIGGAKDGYCITNLERDALALLKEQEKPNGKCVNVCECWDSAYERGKRDALKEQEAVEPFHKCIGKEFSLIEDSHFDYCPYCGKPITWAKQEGR